MGTIGIGAAAARKFAALGASAVALCDLNISTLRSLAEDLRTRYPRLEVECFQVDVAEEASVEAAHDNVRKRLTRIDYAVNSAGISGVIKPTTDMSLQEFQKAISVNMLGTWMCQREQLKQMLQQEPPTPRYSHSPLPAEPAHLSA